MNKSKNIAQGLVSGLIQGTQNYIMTKNRLKKQPDVKAKAPIGVVKGVPIYPK